VLDIPLILLVHKKIGRHSATGSMKDITGKQTLISLKISTTLVVQIG
jgi:hypothetical protein